MPYEFDLETLNDHIRVAVSGIRTPGSAAIDAGRIGRVIAKECDRSQISKVLIVLSLSGRLPALDALEMVTESREYGWSHKFQLAFVNFDPESYDDTLFIETVAVNRAYPMKVFNNEHDAREWLLNT